MASVSTPRPLTAEEHDKLEEVLGFREELIEGERVLSPNAVGGGCQAFAGLGPGLIRFLN